MSHKCKTYEWNSWSMYLSRELTVVQLFNDSLCCHERTRRIYNHKQRLGLGLGFNPNYEMQHRDGGTMGA